MKRTTARDIPSSTDKPGLDGLERGDAAAERGNWTSAVDEWMKVDDRGGSPNARKRVRWLAHEGARSSGTGIRGKPMTIRIVVMVASAVTGFAVLFLFRNSASLIVSVLVWLCISISAVLAILVAHRIGRGDTRPLSQDEIHLARTVASALDRAASDADQPNVRR